MRSSPLIKRRRFFDGNQYGEAANFPIQGTNAEAMKIALIRVDDYLAENPDINGHLVLNVHDEVVVELPKSQQNVANNIKQIMADSLGLFLQVVPGEASVKVLKHWEK